MPSFLPPVDSFHLFISILQSSSCILLSSYYLLSTSSFILPSRQPYPPLICGHSTISAADGVKARFESCSLYVCFCLGVYSCSPLCPSGAIHSSRCLFHELFLSLSIHHTTCPSYQCQLSQASSVDSRFSASCSQLSPSITPLSPAVCFLSWQSSSQPYWTCLLFIQSCEVIASPSHVIFPIFSAQDGAVLVSHLCPGPVPGEFIPFYGLFLSH